MRLLQHPSLGILVVSVHFDVESLFYVEVFFSYKPVIIS